MHYDGNEDCRIALPMRVFFRESYHNHLCDFSIHNKQTAQFEWVNQLSVLKRFARKQEWNKFITEGAEGGFCVIVRKSLVTQKDCLCLWCGWCRPHATCYMLLLPQTAQQKAIAPRWTNILFKDSHQTPRLSFSLRAAPHRFQMAVGVSVLPCLLCGPSDRWLSLGPSDRSN